MTTPIPLQLRVLFFDIFGTCVSQRPSVANELSKAAKEALESPTSSISTDVRTKAAAMTYNDWDALADEWNVENDKFTKSLIATHGSVDWKAVDEQRINLLPRLLASRGLVVLQRDGSSINDRSLWTAQQISPLALIWHRLEPWADTPPGLALLNKKFATATLSNTYTALVYSLVSHGSMPFQHVFGADQFESYKPRPAVYLGAAEERLGVKAEECALVAAHLGDLRGAKECGFFAVYVERPLEEKSPELRGEGIPDLVVAEGEGGFIGLAGQLGIAG